MNGCCERRSGIAPMKFVRVSDDEGWGMMPCGEVKVFYSVYCKTLYEFAYKAEEDEIADELARLEEERFVEYPEDFAM